MRAKKEQFAALHFIVLDDVGTKVDLERLSDFTPSWKIETSRGNYQVGIRLTTPITDAREAQALVEAIASAGLCDRGSTGQVHWFRLPVAINGKPKRREGGEPFPCGLTEFNPDVSYTPDELAEELGLAPIRPSAPSPRISVVISSEPADEGDEVYTPRPAENPVVAELKSRGLYKREIEPGKHDITCPWKHEHTDELDTGAAYFDPSERHPTGGFCCQHSHRAEYSVGKLLDFLQVDARDARWKPIIRLVPGEINRVNAAAEMVLASRGSHYQAGGIIVSIWFDPATGDPSLVTTTEQALTKELAAAAYWERYDRSSKKWQRCDPPARNVQMLIKAQTYEHLPALSGLARQPYFRSEDGELVTEPGYDPISGRFGAFDPKEYVFPEQTREAAVAALKLLLGLVDEFCFASEMDMSAAICAMLMAACRPTLDVAPGGHVRAPTSGTGKSYLCATVSAFASAAHSLGISYPLRADEAAKSVLGMLLSGTAVIEFDDMSVDWVPHSIINRMLTSPTITERVLGVNKTATVSTRVLVLGSGNNVGPVRDLTRRVITIHLDAETEAPATRRFTKEPVEIVRADRGKYVAAALTIIAAYKAAGEPVTEVDNIAGYGAWARYCRQPLLWLGMSDPGAGLLEQIRAEPDNDGLGALQVAWHDVFGAFPTSVRLALEAADKGGPGNALREALEDLPVFERGEINKGKLGWYLRKNEGRVVKGLAFRRTPTSERTAWSVVEVGAAAAPLPVSPPSGGPDGAGGG